LRSAGQSFAFETTLSSRSLTVFIRKLQEKDYRVQLLFFWLPTADQAIARVRFRVLAGGHEVPEETVRRRHGAGVTLFHALYLELVDSWRVYDARARIPHLVARGGGGSPARAASCELRPRGSPNLSTTKSATR